MCLKCPYMQQETEPDGDSVWSSGSVSASEGGTDNTSSVGSPLRDLPTVRAKGMLTTTMKLSSNEKTFLRKYSPELCCIFQPCVCRYNKCLQLWNSSVIKFPVKSVTFLYYCFHFIITGLCFLDSHTEPFSDYLTSLNQSKCISYSSCQFVCLYILVLCSNTMVML